MKLPKTALLLAAIAIAVAVASTPAFAASGQTMPSKATIDKDVDACLNRFYKQIPGAKEAVEKAKGVLVMPGVVQAGFFVGGESGFGAMRGGGATAGYYSLIAGTLGFQIGIAKMDLIILFNNQAAVDKFKNTQGWEAGVDADIVAVNVGKGKTVDWTKVHDDIVSFVFGQKGLMADFSMKGGKFTRIDPK
jgi:lipid-binding SYLF domain-containing protein